MRGRPGIAVTQRAVAAVDGPARIGHTPRTHAALDLDRRDQLRARHRAREALQRRPAQDGALQPAQREDGRPHRPEARRPEHGRGGALRGPRQGLRARARPLRGHRARRARGARARRKTKTIDIEDFVDLADIDPIFYDHPYYLAPGAGRRQALPAAAGGDGARPARWRSPRSSSARRRASSRCGPTDDVLADGDDDLRRRGRRPATASTSSPPPTRSRSTERELDIAKQLVESLAAEWEPGKYQDDLPRAGPRAHRAQGRRRGDRRPAAGRGGRAGARPHERAEGLPRRGARRRAATPSRRPSGHRPRSKAPAKKPTAASGARRKKTAQERVAPSGVAATAPPAPRLRRVDCTGPGLRRRRRGRGFVYLDPDGERVDEPEVLGRIHELVIPPAWEDVWICPYPGGHIQATGIDQRGRKQYLYHPRWRARRDQQKFDDMVELRPRAARAARRASTEDLARDDLSREHVLAVAVRLLDRGLLPHRLRGLRGDQRDLRPGDDAQAPLPGARRRPAASTTPPSTASAASRRSSTREVAAVVERLKRRRGGGDELLAYKERRPLGRRPQSPTSTRTSRTRPAVDVSAKDFRTWGATVLAAVGARGQRRSRRRRPARKRAIDARDQGGRLLPGQHAGGRARVATSTRGSSTASTTA